MQEAVSPESFTDEKRGVNDEQSALLADAEMVEQLN
jgi:hypothetical protein